MKINLNKSKDDPEVRANRNKLKQSNKAAKANRKKATLEELQAQIDDLEELVHLLAKKVLK